MKTTPSNITKLEENQVFVFGSNMKGNHAGGAARTAVKKFGAIEGQAIGLQGQSYAIPTLDTDMEKVSLDDLLGHIKDFRSFANANPEKEFLVTKIGCGIAGFDEDEIKPLVHCLIGLPNVLLPEGWHSIPGFKGFGKDMKCRDMQYQENSIVSEDVDPEICEKGLHYCPMPLDVFNYYPPTPDTTYTEVESAGKVSVGEDKVATNKLQIKTKISISKLFKIHFDLVFDKVKKTIGASSDTVSTHANTAGNYAHANTAGNYAHANTAGNYAHANTAGDEAHANTAGNKAHANTAGNEAHANTAGNKAHANTAGNYAHANTAGYKAHANTAGNEAHANTAGNYAHANTAGNKAHANTAGNYAHANTAGDEAHANTAGDEAHANTAGYKAHANTAGNKAHANTAGNYAHANTAGDEAHASVSGKNSIATSLGVRGQAKGNVGNWIVLTEWVQDSDYNWNIKEVKTTIVDGEKIKANTWYMLVDGVFTEA